MHDPSQKKQPLKLDGKTIDACPDLFIRPERRDPARIDVVLEKLRTVWKRDPDLRLAQLIVNVSGANQPCPEIFYLEDDKLLLALNGFESQAQGDES